jgi:hypothetical protein
VPPNFVDSAVCLTILFEPLIVVAVEDLVNREWTRRDKAVSIRVNWRPFAVRNPSCRTCAGASPGGKQFSAVADEDWNNRE